MAYTAPNITAAGLSIPAYSDILGSLIEDAKGIYGQDIYLESDSQDYQYLSIIASKINDEMQLLQKVYNDRSPVSATEAGLASVVKLNGIKIKSGTYSTCQVILTGSPLAQITNGVVQDITGHRWSLPVLITLDAAGMATVTATCETIGAIAANPGDISIIVTVTAGWTSVTNTSSAALGSTAESGSELRARQATSVAIPSLTVLDSLRGSIANLSLVTRSKIYENDTDQENDKGISAHSIAAVVEGGSNEDIAKVLFRKKAPGVSTQGTTSVDIVDNYGLTNTINFYRPAYIDVDVIINVKRIQGYTDQSTEDIKIKVASLLNALTIGSDVSVSSLWGAALTAMSSLADPMFSITSVTAAIHGEAPGANDIPIAFNEVVRGNTDYITVNVS